MHAAIAIIAMATYGRIVKNEVFTSHQHRYLRKNKLHLEGEGLIQRSFSSIDFCFHMCEHLIMQNILSMWLDVFVEV